jgi:gtrA-like protein|nr:GtrA family protein [uncultured Lachnoanaerobaculum sp.]
MKMLLRQIAKFVGISGIGWILDFCTYTSLSFCSNNIVINNIISSWLGVTFVFIFATRKVFKNNSRISLKKKYAIYLAYQLILIYLISKLLGYINSYIISNVMIEEILRLSTVISKVIITPITMIMNFIVMKSIIERI